MFCKVALLATLAVAVSADGGHHHEEHAAGYAYNAPAHEPTYQKEAPFSFWWAVDEPYEGLKYSHHNENDGKKTKGEYKVLLPDGRTKVVKYTADDYTGFLADVTYEGEIHEDAYKHPKKTYHAPKRTYEHPKQTYEHPKQTYEHPKQTYEQPKQTYEQPKQTYHAPEQTYEAPEHTYEQPEQTYYAPEQTYEQPEHTYEAPEQTYETPAHFG